jgi:hypothetical protein
MDDPSLEDFINAIKADLLKIEANRRSHVVADLTALSLMLDKGLVSLDEVTQRLEAVRIAMGEGYHSQDVAVRVKLLADILRDKHGAKRPAWTPEVIQGGLNQGQNSDPTEPK